MIKPSKLSGTPWHTEFLKMNESDSKRHKSKCKYYIKEYEFCNYYNQKCFGSAHCKYYKELTNKFVKSSNKNINQKNNNLSLINKQELHGEFKILYFEDNNIEKYLVNEEIKNTPLFDEVLYRKRGDIFELNGEKMKIVKKNIYKFYKLNGKVYRTTKL